ncbi:diacylglycerol kinase family lipid kinase [Halobaculum sp. WSA2]|uniref:Diacylglycerol kinase family lipid kinase n=1 Tax=Halobaculum saliterrae TaxID=2073113 RepID=A0A6B0SR79_9EURY|nr:diacylglycerol kinase family protein [Halobaculum saliterrae]MXR41037.1 diacylglycerol kinase family lipid kinase [Halobaculum saliterrae]
MQIGSRRCLVNPHSGTGDHADHVRQAMEARGFAVTETEDADHTIELAREAGEVGVSTLAVCGGDGTINDALRGLYRADALGDVTLAVLPAGTANLLAGRLGIDSLDHGIELSDTGEARALDVGVTEGDDGATEREDHVGGDEDGDDGEAAEPFLVSCIAGLPADASTATSDELKERFGTLAFLLAGARETMAFDGLDVRVESPTRSWAGEATCVLVGNARKFVEEGGQADMEDGRFDVAVVERMPAPGLAVEAAIHRLLGEGTDGVTQFRASELHVESDDEPITFSRDGEVATHRRLDLRVLPAALDVRVGDAYEPEPEYGPDSE